METVVGYKAHLANETLKVIYERRAVRKFKDKPVERRLIEQVIAAGTMAPSAINKQPWKFYVLTSKLNIKNFSKEISKATLKRFFKSGVKEIIKTAAHLLRFSNGINFHLHEDPVFHGASVVIFITAPRDNEWAPLDIGMCAQNMMLAAKSMGLDTCPVGFGKFVENAKSFPKLRIPDSEQVHLSVILGYGNESPDLHERKTGNLFFID